MKKNSKLNAADPMLPSMTPKEARGKARNMDSFTQLTLPFRNDDPSTYLTNEDQMKRILIDEKMAKVPPAKPRDILDYIGDIQKIYEETE